MKVDELLDSINDLKDVVAVENHNDIYIYSAGCVGWFLKIEQLDGGGCGIHYHWDGLEDVEPCVLLKVLSIVKEFTRTPISQRLSEKKYYLVANRDSLKDYVTNNLKYVNRIYHGSDKFSFEYGEPVKFSEWELDNIKKLCPFIAPAIDAMKEPVEDDE